MPLRKRLTKRLKQKMNISKRLKKRVNNFCTIQVKNRKIYLAALQKAKEYLRWFNDTVLAEPDDLYSGDFDKFMAEWVDG